MPVSVPTIWGGFAPTTTMGRPPNDRLQRMAPLTNSRRRARRAALSALAGGGLTAASLGGPLASGALGASVSAHTHASKVAAPIPITVTESGSGAQGSGTQASGAGQPTTTSSTPSPSSTSTAPQASAPAPATPARKSMGHSLPPAGRPSAGRAQQPAQPPQPGSSGGRFSMRASGKFLQWDAEQIRDAPAARGSYFIIHSTECVRAVAACPGGPDMRSMSGSR